MRGRSGWTGCSTGRRRVRGTAAAAAAAALAAAAGRRPGRWRRCWRSRWPRSGTVAATPRPPSSPAAALRVRCRGEHAAGSTAAAPPDAARSRRGWLAPAASAVPHNRQPQTAPAVDRAAGAARRSQPPPPAAGDDRRAAVAEPRCPTPVSSARCRRSRVVGAGRLRAGTTDADLELYERARRGRCRLRAVLELPGRRRAADRRRRGLHRRQRRERLLRPDLLRRAKRRVRGRVAAGHRALRARSRCTRDAGAASPCGACLQVLAEFGDGLRVIWRRDGELVAAPLSRAAARAVPAVSDGQLRSGLVALAGRPNVGKSTLVNRLVGEQVAAVSRRPQTTRRRALGAVRGHGWQMVLVDLPGVPEAVRPADRADAALGRRDAGRRRRGAADAERPRGRRRRRPPHRRAGAAAGRRALPDRDQQDRPHAPGRDRRRDRGGRASWASSTRCTRSAPAPATASMRWSTTWRRCCRRGRPTSPRASPATRPTSCGSARRSARPRSRPPATRCRTRWPCWSRRSPKRRRGKTVVRASLICETGVAEADPGRRRRLDGEADRQRRPACDRADRSAATASSS